MKCENCQKSANCEVHRLLSEVRKAIVLTDALFSTPDENGRIRAAWEIDHTFRITVRALLVR